MVDIKKNSNHVKKIPDHVDLLEDLSSTGTWYLDLQTMTFTEISEKIFELYGISKGTLQATRAFCSIAYCWMIRPIVNRKDWKS